MNEEQVSPYQVTAEWVELIAPVLAGIMLAVLIAGMVRDLFTGKEVKMPL